MPAAGSVAQACFHAIVFPPPLTLPPAKVISSGFALPKSGAIFSATARRAFTAASLTEGDNDAAVVDPPEELAEPSFELPICSTTSLIPSPNSSATIAGVNLRVPAPNAGVRTASAIQPSRATDP